MKIPDSLVRITSKQMLVLKKQSPHILFAAGVAGVVTSAVLACRATLKVGDVLDATKADVDNIKNDVMKPYLSHRHAPELEESRQKREMAFVYGHCAIEVTKLYAPAVVIGSLSIAALTRSHVTLARRNSALTAAYIGLEKAFDSYRKRVRDEVGEEKEEEIYYNATIETVKNPDGTESKILRPKNGECAENMYTRIFDPTTSRFWKNNSEMNRLFLMANEKYFNQRLRVHKHVFLNEVLDELGFERVPEGQLVGWLYEDGQGDGYIDFHILRQENADALFDGGQSFFLEFNVDGPIYRNI